jgi:hypothetical protein
MTNDAMFPTGQAALAAREDLERLAPDAARDERAAARVARAAVFQEALLGALRAHVAELRTVAR